jgi:hypothetical protein
VYSSASGIRVVSGLLSGGLPGKCGHLSGRFSWHGVPRHGEANRNVGDCLVLMMLSSVVLALLLVIGGFEQNSGPVTESLMAVQILCTGCSRNLKSGIQCQLCGLWYHKSC